jgi:AcrR family transcriptional regulator
VTGDGAPGASNGRKRRPAPPVDESRADQILREAGYLFRTKGYEATRMQDIAEATNLTQGALYWHFTSKEEILHRHLLRYEQPWFDGVRAAARVGSPDQQLQAYVRAYVQYQLDHPYFELGWGMLARTGQLMWRLPEEHQQEIWAMDIELVSGLEEILRRGIEVGLFRRLDVHLTAAAIINMSHILGSWIHPVGKIDPATIPDKYADLVLHMVAA